MGCRRHIALTALAAAAWTWTGACGGSSPTAADAGLDARFVTAIPLSIYTDCQADRVNNPTYTAEQCLHVEARAGGDTLFSEWLTCGAFCAESAGFGLGPVGPDGRTVRPPLLRCLPSDRGPVDVSMCIPGYRPLEVTAVPDGRGGMVTIRGVAPQDCEPGAYDGIATSDAPSQISYELIPMDGGLCPPRPPDGGPAPALLCPCP